MKKKWKTSWLQLSAIGLGVFLLGVIVVDFYPVISQVIRSGDRQLIQAYFQNQGWQGIVVLCLLQVVQVITSLVPALSLQLAFGVTLGPLVGSFLCVLAMTAGNMLVFFLAEKILASLHESSILAKSVKKFDQFLETKNKDTLCFFMYLLPILPNLVKPYLAAAAKIKPAVFLVSCTLGSIIPVLAGVLIGDLLFAHQWIQAGLVLLCSAILVILAYFFQKKHPFS